MLTAMSEREFARIRVKNLSNPRPQPTTSATKVKTSPTKEKTSQFSKNWFESFLIFVQEFIEAFSKRFGIEPEKVTEKYIGYDDVAQNALTVHTAKTGAGVPILSRQ